MCPIYGRALVLSGGMSHDSSVSASIQSRPSASKVGLLSVGLLGNHEFLFLLREAKRFGVSILFLCNYYFNYFAFWSFILLLSLFRTAVRLIKLFP